MLGVEDMLSGKCLSLELDEFIQLVIVLIGNCIYKFGNCFNNKIGVVVSERVCSLGVVINAVTSCLCHLSVRVCFGNLFDKKRVKFGEGLVSLGFGLLFTHGSIKYA